MKRDKEQLRRYLDTYRPELVKQYIRMECREELADQTALARMLLRQEFVFCDVWDMEPCHTPYRLDPMVWDKSPNGDMEWVYMLNRHGFLVKLFLAYWDTGESSFIEKLKEYIFHWIAHNNLKQEGSPALRPIDMGIRCGNWVSVMAALMGEGLLKTQEERRILESLEEQFRFLKEHYIEKYTLSNWGILQTTAMIKGLLWFDCTDSLREIGVWAVEELTRQLELQVLEDGSHWEQSLMYHVEVWNACAELWTTRSHLGLPVDEGIRGAVEDMARYLLYAIAPDRTQINQGDSDVSDLRDVMVKAAVLLQDGAYKYCGFSKVDLFSAWMLGGKGIEAYHNLTAEMPAARHGFFTDSGNFFVRSGWDRNASYTYLHSGSLGSSHGHADLTHMTVYYNGIPILADSGRYTYREDQKERVELKSAFSHNVCVIDGVPLCRPSASWEYEAFASPMKTYCRDAGDAVFCEMAYTGETKGRQNCFVKRSVIILHPDTWLIADEIRCDGPHSHKVYYHMHPNVRVDLSGEHLAKLNGDGVRLHMTSDYRLAVSRRIGSETYNSLTTHCCLEGVMNEWNNRGYGAVCLHPSEYEVRDGEVYQWNSPVPLTKQQALVKEFCRDGKTVYCLILLREEIFSGAKLFCYQKTLLRARAAVLKADGQTFVSIRLKN